MKIIKKEREMLWTKSRGLEEVAGGEGSQPLALWLESETGLGAGGWSVRTPTGSISPWFITRETLTPCMAATSRLGDCGMPRDEYVFSEWMYTPKIPSVFSQWSPYNQSGRWYHMCKTNRDHKNTYLSKLVLQAVVVSQINFACFQNWSSDEQKSGKDVRIYFLIQILLNC